MGYLPSDDDELLKRVDAFLAETPKPSQGYNSKAEALRRAALKLGIDDPADLGAIISFETGGTFDPHKVGGEGNKYKGLIQFGPEEQKKYYNPKDTFETQVEDGVVRYFQDRFKQAGKSTQGATLEDLYTTVIAGNPNANRNAKDAFGTSAKSGTQRILKDHRPKVLQTLFGGQDARIDDATFWNDIRQTVGDVAPLENDSFWDETRQLVGQPTNPVNTIPQSSVPQTTPEAPETLEAQIVSAFAQNSPKSGVLLPKGNPANEWLLNQSEAKRMTRVNLPEGILLVNHKKLNIAPKDVQSFVKKNGMAGILGYVKDVGNHTSDGVAVTATMDGKEVASAVVTNEDEARRQKEINDAAFPGSVSTVATTDEIAQKREEANRLAPTSPTGEADDPAQPIGVAPPVNPISDPRVAQRPARRPQNVPQRPTVQQPQVSGQVTGQIQEDVGNNEVKDINDNFTETITFDQKPDDVSNKEYFIQNLIPRIASRTGFDASDIEAELRNSDFDTLGQGLDKGTPLSDIAKDKWFEFVMSPQLAEKILARTARRLDTEKRKEVADADFNERKKTIAPELSGADRDLEEFRLRGMADIDAGLITPEQQIKAYETLKKDVEAWKEDKGFLGQWNQKEWAEFMRFMGGRPDTNNKVSESYQPTGLGEEVKTPQQYLDKAYADMQKQYGSATAWKKAQKEYKARFENSPMTFLMKGGESAVGGAIKAPLKGAASALKAIAIGSEAIDRVTGKENPEAMKKYSWELANDIEQFAEGINVDKDFKGGNAELAGDVFGQVIVQTGLGILTGGAAAPALFGAGQGIAEGYETGTKEGLNGWTRLGKSFAAGLIEAPDYFIFHSMLKGGNALNKLTLVQRMQATVKRGLIARGIVAPVAEKASVAVAEGFLTELSAKEGVKGTVGKILKAGAEKAKIGGAEFVQESTTQPLNDMVAYITYDRSPERWAKATTPTGEMFVEGVAGFFGGIVGASLADISARYEGLSDEGKVQVAKQVEAVKKDLPPQTYADIKKVIEKSPRRKETLKPLVTETTKPNAQTAVVPQKPASLDEKALVQDQPVQKQDERVAPNRLKVDAPRAKESTKQVDDGGTMSGVKNSKDIPTISQWVNDNAEKAGYKVISVSPVSENSFGKSQYVRLEGVKDGKPFARELRISDHDMGAKRKFYDAVYSLEDAEALLFPDRFERKPYNTGHTQTLKISEAELRPDDVILDRFVSKKGNPSVTVQRPIMATRRERVNAEAPNRLKVDAPRTQENVVSQPDIEDASSDSTDVRITEGVKADVATELAEGKRLSGVGQFERNKFVVDGSQTPEVLRANLKVAQDLWNDPQFEGRNAKSQRLLQRAQDAVRQWEYDNVPIGERSDAIQAKPAKNETQSDVTGEQLKTVTNGKLTGEIVQHKGKEKVKVDTPQGVRYLPVTDKWKAVEQTAGTETDLATKPQDVVTKGKPRVTLPTVPIEKARVVKFLNRAIEWDGVTTAQKLIDEGVFVSKIAEQGGTFDRKKFNRVADQEAYEKEVASKVTYGLVAANGDLLPVPKSVYDAIEFGEQETAVSDDDAVAAHKKERNRLMRRQQTANRAFASDPSDSNARALEQADAELAAFNKQNPALKDLPKPQPAPPETQGKEPWQMSKSEFYDPQFQTEAIKPLGFTENAIVFDNDASVNPEYYDAITKRYPDATFVGQVAKGESAGTQNALIVVKDGDKVVGAVMPLKTDGGRAKQFTDNKALRSTPERYDDIVSDRGIDYDKAKDVARRIESGSLEIRRLNPEAERGRLAGGQRAIEASVILAGDAVANQANRSQDGSRLGNHADTVARQERLLEQYAKKNDIWFKSGHFPTRLYVGRGGEAIVYQKDANRVAKIIDYKHIDKSMTPQRFLDDRIALFNYLFPESAYEVAGFMRDANGKFRVVVNQKFITGTDVKKQADVDAMMSKMGLERTGKESYSNDLYEVHDLHVGNVVKNGNTVHVIDAVPKAKQTLPFEIVEADRALRSTPDPVEVEVARQMAAVKEVRNDKGQLLAPNGKVSNLNEFQWKQVRTENFKEFFGDWINDTENASQVVDENGEPLVVYHGTDADFDAFNTRRNKANNRMGAYFTDNPDAASMIHSSPAKQVIPTYLTIQNPFDIREIQREKIAETANLPDEAIHDTQTQGRAGQYATLEWLDRQYDLVPKLKRQGYDGIIFDGNHEGITYVVFSPNQIKSAIGNRGTFYPNEDSIMRSVADEPFYSRVESVIRDKMPNRATPAQITALLAKNSVKELDPEFQAIKVWLDGQDGTVGKADVLAFVDANKVVVSETVFGKDGDGWQGDELIADGERIAELTELEDGKWSFISDFFEGTEPYDSREEAKTAAEEATIGDPYNNQRGVHFAQFQLPGESENYREEFLTAPDVENPARDSYNVKLNALKTAIKDRLNIQQGSVADNTFNPLDYLDKGLLTEAEATQTRELYFGNVPLAGTNWKDGHSQFDDVVNPIARVRYNDRVTTDGDKMLFAEEIQQPSKENLAKMPKVYQKFGEEMAIRKMLYRAVEGGYDYFGFTTGEQQADRYNLAKYVSQIEYWKSDRSDLDGDRYGLYVYDKNNKLIFGTQIATVEELDANVGKELAKKIIEDAKPTSQTLKGLDLKVGGEGLINRYDRKHVDYINKLMKPYGVQVESKEINTIDPETGFDDGSEIETIHAVRISPEFRKAVEASMAGNGGAFPLFKLRDLDTQDAMADIKFAHTEDILAGLKGGVMHSNGEIELSPAEQEYLRRAIGEDYFNRTGEEADQQSFDGMMLNRPILTRLVKIGEDYRQTLLDVGYTENQLVGYDALQKTLKDALDTKEQYPIVYVFDDALPEERTHREDFELGRTDAKSRDKINEIFPSDIRGAKFNREYGDLKDADQISEIAAKIETGQSSKYGWDKIDGWDKLSKEITSTWAKGIIEKNRAKIDAMGIDAFLKRYPVIGQYYAETTNTGTSRTTEGSQRGQRPAETNSEGDGRGAEAQTQANDASEGRSSEKQKVAAFSRILGQDVLYTPQSHAETETIAQQLLSDKGTQDAIFQALNGKPSAEGMRVVYWELERLNGLADHYLASNQNEEYAAVAGELSNLASQIVARQIANGRETEIAKTLAPLSPEVAIVTATKMKRYATGADTGLTEVQTKQVTEIAKQLKETNQKLAEETAKRKAAERKIKRLENDREPVKRTVQAKMLKEYQASKPDLLAALRDAFPNSPMFNGESAMRMVAGQNNAMRSVAEKSLDPDKSELLTKYAVGMILEGKTYAEVIGTLEAIAETDVRGIHAKAVEIIKPAKAMTDEAKQRVKTRNEHYKEAEAYNHPNAKAERALAAVKKRIEAQINKLNNEIKSGKVETKEVKLKLTSPEIEALEAQRDGLRKRRDEMFAAEMTPEKRAELAEKAVQRSIEALQKQIDEGKRANKKPAIADTAHLKELKAQRDGLRKRRDEMFAAEMTPEKRAELAEKAVQRSIEALQKQIDEGKRANKKPAIADTAHLKELKAQRDGLRKRRDEMFAAEMTPEKRAELAEKAVQRSIEALQKQIDEGKRANKKPAIADTAHLKELKAQRDGLRKRRDEMFAAEMTPEKRAELAEKAVQRSIEALQKQIDEGKRANKKPAIADTAHLKELKAQRDGLRKRRDEMFAAEMTPEKRAELAEKAVQRSIEALQKQIDEGKRANKKPAIADTAHLKELKAQRDELRKRLNQSTLSGLAQDAQDAGQDKQTVWAVNRLTNGEPRNLNDIVRELRKEFGLTIDQATNVLRKANALVKQLKSERQQKADELKGILPEMRAAENAARIAKQNASMKMQHFFNQIAKRPWLMERFNNDFRAKLVSNWGTQIFNAVQGVASTATESVIDVFESLVKLGLDPNSDTTIDINPKDAWIPLAYLSGSNNQLAAQALSNFTEDYYRIHAGLLGDIEMENPKYAPDANKLTYWGHRWFDKQDEVNRWLSKVSLAKVQEMHFRNASIAATFEQIIRRKSGGKATLKSAMADGTLLDYITENDAKIAADRALRITFASMIDDPVGRQLKRAYDQLDKVLPVILNPVTFARFTYTTTKVMALNPMLIGALDSKALGGQGYNARSLAKGIMAWSGVAVAYGLLSAFGDDDDRWETITINGVTYDVRRWFPMSAFFYMAHIIKSQVEGRPLPSAKELLEGFASLETDYFAAGPGMKLAGTAYEVTQGRKDVGDLGVATSAVLASILSGWLRFVKPVKDALAQFNDEESAFREYDDSNWKQATVKELAKTLPFIGRTAPKQLDAITGQPLMAKAPLARMFGVNIVHPSFLNAKQTPATEWAEKVFVYTPTSEWSKEQKQAFYIRKRIKNAIWRKEVTPSEVQGLIQKYVQDGKLTQRSADILKDDIKLSELQVRVKYGYKPGDKPNPLMDRKLQQVMRRATDVEKQDIENVIGNRIQEAK